MFSLSFLYSHKTFSLKKYINMHSQIYLRLHILVFVTKYIQYIKISLIYILWIILTCTIIKYPPSRQTDGMIVINYCIPSYGTSGLNFFKKGKFVFWGGFLFYTGKDFYSANFAIIMRKSGHLNVFLWPF